MMKLRHLIIAVATATCATAHAGNSINLSNYQVTGNYTLDALAGVSGNGVSGLEASAVTYARDRGTLFFVGDEGTGVVEVSLTGQTLGTMAFSNWPTASTNHDSEGLTYLGGGVLVVTEERLQDAFRFNYVAGGSVALANADYVSIGSTVGNVGTEGISYDPRNGSFVSVKQDNPQALLIGGLTFASTTGGGVSTMSAPFNADTVLGLNSLSDVQTLAPVDALFGTAAADNLLVLSLDSRKLIEINRSGALLSSFDLAGVTTQAIEGVTVDEKGVIYLVAEDSGMPNSRLFVLTPVPEPEVYAMMLAGLGLIGCAARQRRKQAQK